MNSQDHLKFVFLLHPLINDLWKYFFKSPKAMIYMMQLNCDYISKSFRNRYLKQKQILYSKNLLRKYEPNC